MCKMMSMINCGVNNIFLYLIRKQSFNYKMVKFVLTSYFHKKVRATRGLVPTSQLSWWCYIQFERTIWEQNGLIETQLLEDFLQSNCKKRPENPGSLLIERPPRLQIEHVVDGLLVLERHFCLEFFVTYSSSQCILYSESKSLVLIQNIKLGSNRMHFIYKYVFRTFPHVHI